MVPAESSVRYDVGHTAGIHRGVVFEQVQTGPTEEPAVIPAPGGPDSAVHDWPDLAGLIAHIVARHHGYVRVETEAIRRWIDRLSARAGPGLGRIRAAVAELAAEFEPHLLKEEHLVFPYIRELERAAVSGQRMPNGPFGTVLNPIRMMEADHRRQVQLVAEIRELAHGLVESRDDEATVRQGLERIAAFEQDLRVHVHLEHDLLFPRALDIERRLL
jgi:regulator of cell morphogenesis and NO signaling